MGDSEWINDYINAYNGKYYARSGIFSAGEKSIIELELDVLSNGYISFYKKHLMNRDWVIIWSLKLIASCKATGAEILTGVMKYMLFQQVFIISRGNIKNSKQ